jgi:hypothetical protein
LLSNSWVKATYQIGCKPAERIGTQPVIRPEIILPYQGAWYVLGESINSSRTVMLRIGDMLAVSKALVTTTTRIEMRVAS